MKPPVSPPALPLPQALSDEDEAALSDLFRKGTPENTLRAWERDLLYIAAWKRARFGAELAWPEEERVALRFVLDHAVDLSDTPGPAQEAALALIGAGLRRTLDCPAPATLDRRIASWRAFHRMRNLPSPFEAPLVAAARIKARRAAAKPRQPKSPRPLTREVLERLLATCDGTFRGLRDRAILMLAFASGGRRRSEVTALYREDIGTADFAARGLIWVRLLETKTTRKDEAPRLPLKGRAAVAVMDWITQAGISAGPLFRPVSQADRVLARGLRPDALRHILRHRLKEAGLPEDYATPHGLRAGFLTQAALDGAPLAAAMKLSLHRSVVQAQKYYADVEIEDNPATDLLG
ncbi:tyrosine-type recombinase/integrase [Albidovulum sediminicola]|uniref:Tyrosine-type recombinase/integrase n=1 Tax=Albidovulum sediminicola TaxID=2984331 RepID=A0ABT2Z5L6_9RHOB|nr:tyrosine-type recombinase/integrase [Defluviimonas sp. WL0075]MCV2866388.1 tyrosine-type recombinase/integrase [Defluviimonas sp. WL0075]